MKHLLSLLLFLPLFSTAQGVKFEEGLSWEQIKQKAKQENKSIFVDAYATWCVPCKKMDKEVYTDGKVGEVLNKDYISVKVQMDKTDYDDEGVKRWYNDAKKIKSNYTVTAFPTFLFFYPDSRPMHKSVGYKTPEEFIETINQSLDTQKQYYRILSNFQPGKIDTSELKGLARSLKFSGKELSWKIAIDYLTRIPSKEINSQDNLKFMGEFNSCPEIQVIAVNYLKRISPEKLSDIDNLTLIRSFKNVTDVQIVVLNYLNSLDNKQLKVKEELALLSAFKDNPKAKEIADRYIARLKANEIYTKDNIELLNSFTKSSKDKGFNIFYNHNKRIDSVMAFKGYSHSVVDYIIKMEEIRPYSDIAKENKHCDSIDWKKIRKIIKKKYDKNYADRIVLSGRVAVYKYFTETFNKNWPEYIKYNIELLDKYGTDTTSGVEDAFQFNNFSWDAIFLHSTNKSQLTKAIKWMEGVMRRHPEDLVYVDTYANLLYKIGNKPEAIKFQQKALTMAVEQKLEYWIKMFSQTVDKMKKGIPTWIEE